MWQCELRNGGFIDQILEFQFSEIDIGDFFSIVIFLMARVVGNKDAAWTKLDDAGIRTVATRG